MEKNQDPLDLNQQGTEKIQHPSDETPDQKINLLY